MSLWRCMDCFPNALFCPGPYCPVCNKAALIAIITKPVRVELIDGKGVVFEINDDGTETRQETSYGDDPGR